MRKILLFYLIFQSGICLGQNIKLEIADYSKKIEGKEYATYQFVRSSYSYSRATLVIITSRSVFLEISNKIPNIFNNKQEYTDVWVLGISGFDSSIISDTDKKIIATFFQKIIKYRADNDLPPYSFQRLEENRIIIKNQKDLCRYISCGNRQSW